LKPQNKETHMATRKQDTGKILSRRVLVIIDRDMTAKTPRVVWQHEIPVLEAVFGEGKIIPVDATKMDEGYSAKTSPDLLPFNKVQDAMLPPSLTASIDWVFINDPRVEYDRMAALYGASNEDKRSFVELVYGRFQEGRFSQVIGSAVVEDLPESQLRDLIKGYGFIPATSKDSTDAERAEAKAKTLQLSKASQAELVKLAETVGVTLE
jgi:hypothetical protein